MSTKENPACDHANLLPDYAFDELAQPERKRMEQHLTQCSSCAAELDQLRLTTAVLRILPDQEVPRRIAFVLDQPPATNWLAGIWNSAARLGFASACVLAIGLSFAAYHREPAPQPAVQTAAIPQAAIQDAVNKAVAFAVDKAHAEDVRMTKAALDAVDDKYAQKQRNLLVSLQEAMEYQQKRANLRTSLAMLSDNPTAGAGQ
jgi:anti-sigma factor RsiW